MSSDSTVASKQARLLAQKQRRLECHRQGVAVSLLLETGFARALSTSRAFVTWRMLAVSAPEAPSTTARPPTARTVLSASVLPGGADAADAGVLQQRLVEAQRQLLEARQLGLAAGDTAAELRRELARERAERRLVVAAIEEDWRERLGAAEREAQAAMVRHLYEKQELVTAHTKSLRRAEFDRLDMLAQQEARAKVREDSQYSHALSMLHRLRAELHTRDAGAAELVRLLQAEEEAQNQIGALTRRLGEGDTAAEAAATTATAAAAAAAAAETRHCAGKPYGASIPACRKKPISPPRPTG